MQQPPPPLTRSADWLAWIAIGTLLLAYFSFSTALKDATAPLLLHLAVMLSVIVSGLRFSSGQALRLPANWCWLGAALFTFWGLLSKLWADNPAFHSQAAYLQLEVFFLFLLMPQLAPDRRRMGQLARVALIASTAFASAAIWSRLTGTGRHSLLGFGYPTGNPNLTTLLLEPGLMLALGGALYLWSQGRRRESGLAGLALGVHLAALLLNRSIGGMLGVGAGLLLLTALLQHGARRRICLASGLLAVVLVFAVFARPPEAVRGSVVLRQAFWKQAWGLYTSNRQTTLIGRGLGNYLPSAIPYRHDDYFRQPVRAATTPHPHNYLLRTAAELGGVGILLLLFLLLTLVDRALRLAAKTDRPDLRYRGAIGLAGLASLMAHANVTWFLSHPLGLFLFWGWAGALAATVEQPVEPEPPRLALGLSVSLLPAAMLGMAYTLFVALPFTGQLDAYRAKQLIQQARTTPGPAQRAEQYRTAADYLERAIGRVTTRAETFDSLMMRDRLGQVAFLSGNARRALDAWGLLESICPGFGQNQWRIASVSTSMGEAALANRFYLLYFQRDPVQPAAYDEWWRHHALLKTDGKIVDRIVGQIQRGVLLLPPGEQRQQLLDLQRRFEVLLQN